VLVVAKASESITFPVITNQIVGTRFTPSSTCSSGLGNSISVVSGPAYLTNGQCVLTNIGTVVLAANQAGNSNYLWAPTVTRAFQVLPGDKPFFSTVGDPRNPCEDGAGTDVLKSGIGYVGQPFQISVSEITNLMYVRFLNAVESKGQVDPYGLYVQNMNDLGGISRSIVNGVYRYSVKPGYENKPVTYVGYLAAIRYINWLHNGMPTTGICNDATTETGAYTLNGNDSMDVTRNDNAAYFLPNQDEWHKAAFFAPNYPGSANGYWGFANESNSSAGNNFSASLANVPASTATSYYGTYDQSGNADEWIESANWDKNTFQWDLMTISPRPVSGKDRGYTIVPYTTQISSLGFRVAKTIPYTVTNTILTPILTTIGDLGNPGDQNAQDLSQLGDYPLENDAQGTSYTVGEVDYLYKMGTYEVSNTEYAAFLNAVASVSDTHALYSIKMGTDTNGGILRGGHSGAYSYSVRSGFEKKPVAFVTLYSAMRFCNWLHNGAQTNGDTEQGAYPILGNINQAKIQVFHHNSSARYFLPSVSEWHKAAFYDPNPPGLPSDFFWNYATRSQTTSAAQINYSGSGLNAVNSLGVASHYGTFGQSGNAAEWTEDVSFNVLGQPRGRIAAGGSWRSTTNGVSSSGCYTNLSATSQLDFLGFRIAAAGNVPSGQQITFILPATKTYVAGGTFQLSATTTSGLPITYTSGNTSILTISGTTATMKGRGSVTITAKQAGNANYAPASISASTTLQ
jgi:formylglycine-generating enzyme required for sulfatase activity